MNNLEIERKKIEEIDKQMAKLFEERMKSSLNIANFKKENNLPIYDKTRENFLIKKNTEYIQNNELKDHYQDFLVELMNISKKYQEEKM